MYNPSRIIKSEPVILGLESSCDETAAALIRGRTLLSSRIISSADEHKKFGGVVPEIPKPWGKWSNSRLKTRGCRLKI